MATTLPPYRDEWQSIGHSLMMKSADWRSAAPASPTENAYGNNFGHVSEGGAVLPVNCKVFISGNNRTKNSLIGKRGVIVQAGDLGGWHSLLLEDGQQVRLQRNALSVIEYPATARLPVQERRPGPLYRVPPSPDHTATYLHAMHQPLKKTKGPTRINFAQLGSGALRKYSNRYNLHHVGHNASRTELVTAVTEHFAEQEVDEHEVLAAMWDMASVRHKERQSPDSHYD